MRVHTVLHVDDDAQLRASVARVLRKEPYEMLGVAGAAEALAVLRACLVDVIVCDEAMPGMQGTELLARLRQEFPEVVTILLTGHASLEVAQRAVNHGAVFRILTKPCEPADLAAAIRQALKQRLLIEHTPSRARTATAQMVDATTGCDDPYPTVPIIEVEDVPVDLQQLLAEVESGLEGTVRAPSARIRE